MVDIAIVGMGNWGPNLLRNFRRVENARVRMICDIDATRLAAVEGLSDGAALETKFENCLTEDIDAIVLSVPSGLHHTMAEKAIEAGKHVFVEKPLSLTTEGAENLVSLSEKAGSVLMVGHVFEFNAAVEKAKEIIDSGEIGDIYYIYSHRLNLGTVRQDVNAMWNLAPHDVSIILYWLGAMPHSVSATGITKLQDGIHDVVFLTMEFGGEIVAHIHTSWLDPNKVRKMTVVGSKKMIVYDDTSPDRKIAIYDKGIDRKHLSDSLGQYGDFGEFQLIHRAGDVLFPKIAFEEPLYRECRHFITCIQNGESPLTDGRDGVRVVRVLEAGQESLMNSGALVRL